jgi:hypothetical protein
MKIGGQIELRNCPHCGVAKPLIYHVVTSQAALPRGDGGRKSRWAMYGCSTCGQALLAKGEVVGAHDIENPDIVRVIPSPRQAHADLPELARGFLQQAYETMHAPDAAGIMAASAVDAMLKELGYAKGSLYDRIDKAVEEKKLTANMGEWAHTVRLGANRPRHADAEKPRLSAEEAQQSVEFAEALGQFLFVLSARIQRGIDAAKAAEA